MFINSSLNFNVRFWELGFVLICISVQRILTLEKLYSKMKELLQMTVKQETSGSKGAGVKGWGVYQGRLIDGYIHVLMLDQQPKAVIHGRAKSEKIRLQKNVNLNAQSFFKILC